jgi:histidinol-phosphate/aromatic aminotransferase/cobyric acid decarboxylase-like protein
LQDDTLLLESDLIFEDRVIGELLQNPEPTLAVVAPFESWMDGTVVQIADDNIITNFIPRKSFNYKEKSSYYKTVNIYKFSKEFSKLSYVPFLEAYSQAMGNNEYYEQVLRVITTLDKNELKALVLSDHKWYEIDDAQDKDIAETIFNNSADEEIKLISRRYGGYWRFPKLLDFCYLVNPYFPTEQMRAELKDNFDDLLTQYPSGLNVQNLLAGKLFNIDEENILVGNGAAELIQALAPAVRGTVGIIYPTFNEYQESFSNEVTVVPLYPQADGMAYAVEDLIKWSLGCDTLVLINPDNPSGNYIPRADVLSLLEVFKQQNKRLILDESFIDFCDAEESCSVLQQEILDQYPGLVLIKSLSKSYGIPGIRLGALASGDKPLIKLIRKNLPIWNINSLAEYFLQIIGKYQKDYRRACKYIAQERRRFKQDLENTGLFTVYPSEANYFLCRCLGIPQQSGNSRTFGAGDLAKYLLKNHAVFIKDLSGKKGFSDDKWVRLAIRDMADNKLLIEKLYLFKENCINAPPSPPR